MDSDPPALLDTSDIVQLTRIIYTGDITARVMLYNTFLECVNKKTMDNIVYSNMKVLELQDLVDEMMHTLNVFNNNRQSMFPIFKDQSP